MEILYNYGKILLDFFTKSDIIKEKRFEEETGNVGN